MKTFTHILFPTDGSDSSVKALNYVIEIAVKFHPRVTILNTYELPFLNYDNEIPGEIYDEIIKKTKIKSRLLLEKTKRELQNFSKPIKMLSLQGNAGKWIIDTADLKGCDLIIMGSRGLGLVKGLFLGSVSNYVVHQSKCPVFLVH